MEQSTTFAKRLKEARIKAGLTQAELSKKAGVTAASISAYESSDGTKGKNPSLENAKSLAEALGVSLDWLSGMSSSTQLPTTDEFDGRLDAAVKYIVALIECQALKVDEIESSVYDYDPIESGMVLVNVMRPRLTINNISLSNAISCISALCKIYHDGILPEPAYRMSKEGSIEQVAGYTIRDNPSPGIYNSKGYRVGNDDERDDLPF